MPHLMLHLVDELEICGPVHSRWCYSIERYVEQEIRDSGEVLLGKGRYKQLNQHKRDQIHKYILKNTVYTQDLLR